VVSCAHCHEDHPDGSTYCPKTGLVFDDHASILAVGEVLEGKYRIIRQLAAGAMGVVYVAQHLTLHRHVAVKALRRELVNDPELVGRFEQEARAASAIGHGNIIDVFDLGRTADGSMYMVMELLDGHPLSELLDEEPLFPVARALDLMAQALGALHAAHKHGIVHRDLKPENIFVLDTEDRPDFVKLLDFGISKIAAGNERLGSKSLRGTSTGTVMGTPEYMSPEQARGKIELIDARTDIYAAGVVLYEMLAITAL
jgi:eukaryotic-like serine/threonine-protein kinase